MGSSASMSLAGLSVKRLTLLRTEYKRVCVIEEERDNRSALCVHYKKMIVNLDKRIADKSS